MLTTLHLDILYLKYALDAVIGTLWFSMYDEIICHYNKTVINENVVYWLKLLNGLETTKMIRYKRLSH